MPLYHMLCITAHYPQYHHIKSLVHQACTHLLDAGAVVRSVRFLGSRELPQRMRRHGQYRTTGDYWTLHFDTSPRTLRSFNAIMRRDPRVIRWTVLKLANRPYDAVPESFKTLHYADKAT